MRCLIVVLLEKLADMPIWAIDSYLLKTIQVIYRVDEKDKAVIIITIRYTPSAF